MFIEITAGDERDSPGLEVARHNVVTWRIRSLFHWRHVAIRACVKRAISTRQGNITADSRALDAWRASQRSENLLGKTLTRRYVWILRVRQRDRARPQIMRLEPEILLGQPNETRDQQRRAGEQCHLKCDLRTDENFAESLLSNASTGAAAAFL